MWTVKLITESLQDEIIILYTTPMEFFKNFFMAYSSSGEQNDCDSVRIITPDTSEGLLSREWNYPRSSDCW